MVDPPPFERPWLRRRLAAPRDDLGLLVEPGLRAAEHAAADNRHSLDARQTIVGGLSLRELRLTAKSACLEAAAEYTGQLLGAPVTTPDSSRLLFVSGHQPALFHPGVWIKNFLIGQLAERSGGLGLNLVVDNDIVASRAIRVPQGTRDAPQIEMQSFDLPHPPQPWEDAEIQDPGLFASFGTRVTAAMQNWGLQPLAAELWPHAAAHQHQSLRLADCLTAARQQQERRWGLRNLELPLSRLCETEPFLRFVCHLFGELPRFHDCHNTVLREYRQVNRVRSHTHPVPELAVQEGWLEAPFWVWNQGETHRRHVFVRPAGGTLALSDGRREFATLPALTSFDAVQTAVAVLHTLPAQGLRFRTRALTTTLFARLCLADQFVHGIGGAKYDELTDRMIARFFGVAPPAFVTATATLRLPLGAPHAVNANDARRLRHSLRDLDFNAERHGLGSAAADLIAVKQQLIAAQQAAPAAGLTGSERRARRPANRERHRQLREVERQLALLAEPQRQLLRDALSSTEQQLAANRLLQDREYAYCLHPAESLLALIARLASHP